MEITSTKSIQDFKSQLKEMPVEVLQGQSLVQQGAIHALSTLMQIGCTEANATAILASLRENSRLIREETARRGRPELFETDQTGFH